LHRQYPSPVRIRPAAPIFIRRRGTGGGSGGSGVGGDHYSGAGSPEGVVTAVVNATYVQTDRARLWYKVTGAGNTGWQYQTNSTTGTVDPNGSVFGRPGDKYLDTVTGISYTKGSGNDTNTGWV